MAEHTVEVNHEGPVVLAACAACLEWAVAETEDAARIALDRDIRDDLQFFDSLGDRLSPHMARVRNSMREHVSA